MGRGEINGANIGKHSGNGIFKRKLPSDFNDIMFIIIPLWDIKYKIFLLVILQILSAFNK